MMKLVYLDTVRLPTEKANGYQICKMCEEFSRLGVEAELIVPKRANPIKDDVFSYYQLEKNFAIRYLEVSDLATLERFFGRFGYFIHSLLFLAKAVALKIDRRSVIYTRKPEIAWLFGLRGYRTVFEVHNWPVSKQKIYRYFLAKVDRFITITLSLEEILIDSGLPERKILVAPDGVDLEKFELGISKAEARKESGLPLDKKIILYAGHLYEWKGTQVLADASQHLKDDELVVFVGGTEEDLMSFREKNKGLKNILIVGYRPYSEIPLFLRSADVLVLPNSGQEAISRLYTSPLKLFEYMASGRPLIASDLPSIREIIDDSCAWLVKPDDSRALSLGIRTAIDSQAEAERRAANALARVSAYSWKNRANNIIKALQDDISFLSSRINMDNQN